LKGAVKDKIRKAFRELHRLGIMHGDVRAANILVAPEGSVWIIDFESAEVVSDSTKSEMLESENAEVERLLNDLMSGR
jgi:RIO-like serine/threonine protein kinase